MVVSAKFEEWIIGLGWDSDVLSWGALGGVFSNDNIQKVFPSKGEVPAVELVCVAILLVVSVIHIGTEKGETF